MKNLLSKLGIWLARKGGVILIVRPRAELIAVASDFVRHVESAPNGWEWKQRQCIRAMMNRFPKERIRTLNLAIEIAVQECLEY